MPSKTCIRIRHIYQDQVKPAYTVEGDAAAALEEEATGASEEEETSAEGEATAGLEEAAAAAAGVLDEDPATAAGELATVARVVAEDPLDVAVALTEAVEDPLVLQYCSRADSTPTLLR
jgi:predicted 2-oxoglutarate/Fe(II)-dependent dioxygenase YbiX